MSARIAPATQQRLPWVRILIWIPGLLLIVPAAALMALHIYLNDRRIPVAADLFPPGAPRKLLAIFPHPDDEVTVAGTLSLLRRTPGTEITIAHLTHGEKGPTGGLVTREQLGAARKAEAQAAAQAVGAMAIMLDYPDGGLVQIEPAQLKRTIQALIQRVQPSVILTFDDMIGLYGHMDHVVAARYVREVFQEEQAKATFPVKRLYMSTLPQPVIDLGLKLFKICRDRYPTEPGKGLPAPTVAVKIASESTAKGAVVRAHKTQWRVMKELQPLFGKIDPWLYYRILDREYFTLAEGH